MERRMTQPQLIPKRRKRKKQPTAKMYREQLRLAAEEIIRLRLANADLRRAMDGATLATWRVELPRPSGGLLSRYLKQWRMRG